jgi:hypothetical protein
LKFRQVLLWFFLTLCTLFVLTYNSGITRSANGTYQQSTLAVSKDFVSTNSVILNSAVNNGNLIVVAVSAYSNQTASIDSVSDNFGNSYIQAIANPATPSGNHYVAIWYAENVLGGSNLTVTATPPSGVSTYITLAAHEYSGIVINGALDRTQGTNGSGLMASTGQTAALSQPEELIFGAFLHQEADDIGATGGTDFTIRQMQTNGTFEPLVTEEQFVSTQTGYAAGLNWASPATWNGVAATFKLKNVMATATPASTANATAAPAPLPTVIAATPTPTLAAGSGGSSTYNFTSFPVGPGGSDNIPHQLIRTRDDRVYIFGYQGQRSANLKAYWTTTPGLPSASSSWSTTQVQEGELALSINPIYDGDNTVHVLVNTDAGNLKDYVFNISTNTFKAPYLIASGNPTVAGDYVGTSGLSGLIDASKNLQIAYWATNDHIVYRALGYDPNTNNFTPFNGPTQLDIEGNSNHPSLAISPVDQSITVAWVSQSGNAKILVRTRTASDSNWGTIDTPGAATPWTSTSAGINIDQGPSLVIDNAGTKHLTYIENFDNTGDYGHTHYVSNRGTGWVDTALPSYTHDPAIALNSLGDVFIIGHGHANNADCKSNLDLCVSKRNSDGTWPSPTLFLAHPANGNFDSSPSVKWSVVANNRPETIEFVIPLIIGDYSNSTLYYGSINSVVGSMPTPTTQPTPTPTAPPPSTPTAAPTAAPTPTISPSDALTPTPTSTPTSTSLPTVVPNTPTTVSPNTPGQTQTLTIQINSGTDDVNQDGTSFSTGANSLWLGTGESGEASYTGLRFNDLQIPSGANIVSARLQVYSVQNGWISVDLNLAAEASSNSPAFSNDNLPSQRSLTRTQLSHSSNDEWESNTWYEFDEIAPVVQEIINRGDWQSGNSLSIIMKGTSKAWSRKFIQDYGVSPTQAVKLVIIFQ